MSAQNIQNWIGKQETVYDVIHAKQAGFMQATLDQQPSICDGDKLPPLWHWLYFLEAKPASALGRDAHPKKGGFLPPIKLPRRMWAGGRFNFHTPLIVGKPAEKKSKIIKITEKDGRTGKLCFVTVEHKIFQNGQTAITEEHDIVYREDPKLDGPTPALKHAPELSEFERKITPTQVMLFRYSALTFNGHRIHYDVDYARNTEGYEGLVFHGPLTATLLIDLAIRNRVGMPKSFQFKGLAPIAGMDSFKIEGIQSGQSTKLWAKRADGVLAMSAQADFE